MEDFDRMAPGALARNEAEARAFIEGSMGLIMAEALPPGRRRWAALQQMRLAAKLDPTTAYNLGMMFSGWGGDPAARPCRQRTALKLFGDAVSHGLERLREPDLAYEAAPRVERMTRELVSWALTNIGGELANAGDPRAAVPYFRDAIRVFPGNANAYVCLGNMGLLHAAESGVEPLAAVSCWEKADAMAQNAEEPDSHRDKRDNVVRIVRQIELEFGAEVAREWITERFARASWRKSFEEFAPLADTLAGVEPTHAFSQATVTLSEALSDFLLVDMVLDLPLETKVTLAGALAGAFARLETPYTEGDPGILDRALSRLAGVEPLEPYLGDEEWEERGPPETLHLLEEAAQTAIVDITTVVLKAASRLPGIPPEEAVAALMFHLDKGFRRGVVAMIREYVKTARTPYFLVPAIKVGDF